MEFIRRSVVLWGLFFTTVILSIGFIFWAPFIGGTALDSIASIESVQALMLGMSDIQKHSHFLMTIILDMAYPFAYGLLFAGLTLKFSGKTGVWLSFPAFAVIPVDIFENIIQLMALTGNGSLLFIKAVLTPVKFVLFALSGLIAIGSLVFGVVQKIKNR